MILSGEQLLIRTNGVAAIFDDTAGDSHTAPGQVTPRKLHDGDVVEIGSGQIVPADGEILNGAALFDAEPVNGETMHVLGEPKVGRADVICGTRVIAGRIRMRVTGSPKVGPGTPDGHGGAASGPMGRRATTRIAMKHVVALSFSLGIVLLGAYLAVSSLLCWQRERSIRQNGLPALAEVIALQKKPLGRGGYSYRLQIEDSFVAGAVIALVAGVMCAILGGASTVVLVRRLRRTASSAK